MDANLIQATRNLSEILLPSDWVKVAWIASLVSVLMLIGLCAYLSRVTEKLYFRRWTIGWIFFALSEVASIGLRDFPEVRSLMLVQLLGVGLCAVFLFSGCLLLLGKQFQTSRLLTGVAAIGVWSYWTAYHLAGATWATVPVFALMAGACLYTGQHYYRERYRIEIMKILAVGFYLWAAHSLASPFLVMSLPGRAVGYLLAAVLIMTIATGLVLKEEAELADQKYRDVLNASNEAMFVVDLWTLQILDANQAAQRLTKRSATDLMRCTINDLCPDLGTGGTNLLDHRAMFSNVFQPFSEFHILRADGAPLMCEGDTTLIRWRKRPVLAVKVHETDRDHKIGQMVRRADKLSSLGQLIAGVAHELNNPLAVVVGYAQIMARQSNGDERLQLNLQRIQHESERASKIVRDLLSFARPCVPQLIAVDINQLVRNVLDIRESDFHAHQIEVETDLDPNLPQTRADAIQIEQVLNNLVTNATHALATLTESRRALRITTKTSGFFISISVADTGPGIAPAIREKVFDPFFTTKAPGKGTGLGLSISHTILAEHHGKIRVESEPGKGAEFIVELPIVSSEPPATATEFASPKTATTDPQAPKHLLIVDDEPGIREVLKDALSSSGLCVDTVNNGVEAVQRIAQQKFDVIISDLCMPEMDGETLYNTIREKDLNLAGRMIFVTGDTVSPRSREFLESVGSRWLSKPFNIRDVEAAVGVVLGRDPVTEFVDMAKGTGSSGRVYSPPWESQPHTGRRKS